VGLLVVGEEAELRVVPTFGPLVVVDEGPWEITPDIHSLVDRAAHLRDVFAEVTDRFLAALGADAILGDDDRLVVAPVDILEDVIETRGDDLPSELCVSGVMLPAGSEDEANRAGLLGVVVVHPDQVAGVGHHVELVEVLVLHQVVDGARGVEEAGLIPVGQGIDAHDQGVGSLFPDDPCGVAEHVGGDAHRLFVGAGTHQESGGPVSGQPSELEGPIGLVLRDIDPDIPLGGLHNAPDVGLPGGADVGVEEVGLGLVLGTEPVWESEVPEGNERLDPGLTALARHPGILAEGRLVDDPLTRLDPCPFDAEAEMIHSQFSEGGQILVEFAPGKDSLVTAGRCPSLIGKAVPIRPVIPLGTGGASPVLILKRCGGGAPPEWLFWQFFQNDRLGRRPVVRNGRDASAKGKGEQK